MIILIEMNPKPIDDTKKIDFYEIQNKYVVNFKYYFGHLINHIGHANYDFRIIKFDSYSCHLLTYNYFGFGKFWTPDEFKNFAKHGVALKDKPTIIWNDFNIVNMSNNILITKTF